MSRMTPFSSPLMLGFDTVEKTLERIAKGGDGYPPYNIERIYPDRDGSSSQEPDRIRITLAVAGFALEDLEITNEDNQLIVRGRQADDVERVYLHRGIAARQFQKAFLLADGIKIMGATLRNGLLSIDLARPEPERVVKKIAIAVEA